MLVPQIVGVPAESPPVIENWSSTQSPTNWPKSRKKYTQLRKKYKDNALQKWLCIKINLPFSDAAAPTAVGAIVTVPVTADAKTIV